MGIAGLWDLLRPAGKTRSLTELSVTEGFEANPGNFRGYRIGIDASIWFFHAEYGKEGENPVLRTLFFRCATLMRSPFLPLFVFDGPKRPDFKRGKKINKTAHKLIPGMKAIVESFGFEWRTAPGEAEAELAYLNRIGLIDGILSDDVDNFLFGATTVIRNPSNNLSGNRANPVVNAAGKDDKNHTKVYHLADIMEHPDIRLTRGGMILIGLMKGGDYHPGGLARCGPVIAHGLAKCGFGDTLYQAAKNLNREDLRTFLVHWRHEVRQELITNSRGYIGKKQPVLANAITDAFPDIDVLLSYTHPITSESLGKEDNNLKLTWGKEPDLGKLAATCEFYFEWGYREAIIKRFRTVIWHSAVLRILRRAVLDLDAKTKRPGETPPTTPSKRGTSGPRPVETPSKLVARHFSSLAIGTDSPSDSNDEYERLIVKVHSARTHVSTDGILEYRLEIAPSQLVRIAESGVKGTRVPEGPDEWADDDNDEDGVNNGPKKPPPDPESHMRVWMPACMVRLVEPDLVEDFEAIQRKKQQKGKTKGHLKASDKTRAVVTDSEKGAAPSNNELPISQPLNKRTTKAKIPTTKVSTSTNTSTLPESAIISDGPKVNHPIRDLTKKKSSTSNIGPDLRSFFATTKPSNNISGKTLNRPTNNRRNNDLNHPLLGSLAEDSSTNPRLQIGTISNNGKTASAQAMYLYDSNLESRSSKVAASSALCMPFEDDDRLFLSDDPSDDTVSPSLSKRGHKKGTSASSESDSILFPLKKSPRKSSNHTSPRAQRISVGINDSAEDGGSPFRPCSPSPLRPLTKARTLFPISRTTISPLPVIEISSDSESDRELPRATFPLAIARERVIGRSKPNVTKHKLLNQQKAPSRLIAKPNKPEDIIDLT